MVRKCVALISWLQLKCVFVFLALKCLKMQTFRDFRPFIGERCSYGTFHWWRDSSPETSAFSNILALRTQRHILIVISFCVKNQWIGARTVINSHWEPPLPNAPMLGWIMGRGEPRGGKEREIRRQSVPSLRGGGWGDKIGVWCPF